MSDMQTTTDDVNVEAIMQEIRKQILAKKEGELADGEDFIQIEGKYLAPDFYEHLYQAGMAYNQISVKILVTDISIPIIGPLLQKVRYKLHELVVYYVNQVATNQVRFNHHLLRAVSILGEEVEQMRTAAQGVDTSEEVPPAQQS